MAREIKPKTAIVTGGATGLGYAITEQFLEQGDTVVLNGRTESKLQRAAQQLGQSDRIAIIAGDITEPQMADKIVTEAVNRFGRVDVLVNNAGIFDTRSMPRLLPPRKKPARVAIP